jgi:hypothetical protein
VRRGHAPGRGPDGCARRKREPGDIKRLQIGATPRGLIIRSSATAPGPLNLIYGFTASPEYRLRFGRP